MNKSDNKTFIIERSGLSADAKIVWGALSKTQQRDIRKNNPFRGDRNKIILGLKNRKVKVNILVEISGLSKAQLERIINGNKRMPGNKLLRMKHKLSEVRGLIDRAISEIDEV